jgi:hypothetical protein
VLIASNMAYEKAFLIKEYVSPEITSEKANLDDVSLSPFIVMDRVTDIFQLLQAFNQTTLL